MKLFMILLGCKPAGRNIEQHDIFFGIGNSLKELVPDMQQFWPDAGTIHIDAWRTVSEVNGYHIEVVPKGSEDMGEQAPKLFFINLGGYKEFEFEEFHYKILSVAKTKAAAIQDAKQTSFYKHTGFKGAESHIDDKYGVDVDDIYEINDILPLSLKEKYSIKISKADAAIKKDEWVLGYTILNKLQ